MVFLVIFGPPLVKYCQLRYKNKQLDDRIALLKQENNRLEGEKRKLETDATYIERRAREKIGVVRKGEIVLKGSPKKIGQSR